MDNKSEGKGTFIHLNGPKYTGQFFNDKQEGYGIETWPDGAKFEGKYFQGIFYYD